MASDQGEGRKSRPGAADAAGGQTRKEQLGHEGYSETGKKGGLSTTEKSGGERAAREGVDIDESKFRTNKQS
ncbi:unnamed protein product [Miscanthus lutarioriparius]|uniref:Uncharacterized protein n=1 Tax=Miscanthus lutarioriparius TaxID=422564 RepID=A0A811RRL2_9POAL|nr:unnamed protein product [Miscanthus lutarioriparius]